MDYGVSKDPSGVVAFVGCAVPKDEGGSEAHAMTEGLCAWNLVSQGENGGEGEDGAGGRRKESKASP